MEKKRNDGQREGGKGSQREKEKKGRKQTVGSSQLTTCMGVSGEKRRKTMGNIEEEFMPSAPHKLPDSIPDAS